MISISHEVGQRGNAGNDSGNAGTKINVIPSLEKKTTLVPKYGPKPTIPFLNLLNESWNGPSKALFVYFESAFTVLER